MPLTLVHNKVPAEPVRVYQELVDALENGKRYKELSKGWFQDPAGRTISYVYLQRAGSREILSVAFTGSPPQHKYFKVIGARLALSNEF